MDLREIREFRRHLRRFERVTSSVIKGCCGGVTLAQCLVLLELDESGRLTIGQLAAQLRLDNSTLSRTVDGLVGQGQVERSRDETDRRVVTIRLTAAGKAVCRVIHKDNDAWCRRVLNKIPVRERAAVMRSFGVLVQAYLDDEAEMEGSSS